MRIVFLSNYFNHHQKFLSDALFKETKGQYKFIATSKMRDERKALGYGIDDVPEYVMDSNETGINDETARLIDEADVVIIGNVDHKIIKKRIKNNKLIFRYAERPLKHGNQWFKYPIRFVNFYKNNPPNKSIYLLCSSAYTKNDYSEFGLFGKKAFKWGYFPEMKKYDSLEKMINAKERKDILWCGRFLDWKHPGDVIEVARLLKRDGCDFKVHFIGRGEEEEALRAAVMRYELENYVKFHGSMKPENVREYMEKSGIFLFTSDKREGWGAVLNEAMNSGCAVVASHEAGSAPFLINNGYNGYLYESGNIEMLYRKTKKLLCDDNAREAFGKNAYTTIVNDWNADEAAKRFIIIAEKILSKNNPIGVFEDGICSEAVCLSEKYEHTLL